MSDVRIHEQGYRRYDGPRLGVGAAVRSTVITTARYLLGLRRRARSKVLPWGIIAGSLLPAIVFVALTAVIPDELQQFAQDVIPGPQQYLAGIVFLVYLAAAIAGPAALCRDRRNGALALYLASPLTRDTYLLAKATTAVGFLGMVTIVPPLVYVLGQVLVGAGPEGVADTLALVARAVTSGAALAALFGGLSLAAASLTDRQAAASGIVVLYVTMSGAVVGITVSSLDLPAVLYLADLNQVGLESVARLYGDELHSGVPTAAVFAALAAWTSLFAALTRWRYQRLAVTR